MTLPRRHPRVALLAAAVIAPLLVSPGFASGAAAAPVGRTVHASVASDGTPGNGYSASPSLSSDGEVVLFSSTATNLVPGFPGGGRSESALYTRDLRTGRTAVAAVAPGGRSIPMVTGAYDIDDDGSTVVFSAAAIGDLAPDADGPCAAARLDERGWERCIAVFVQDSATGRARAVSLPPDGTAPDGRSDEPRVSADGRFVVFWSEATNLVPGDTNGTADVFLRDLVAGTTTRLDPGDTTGARSYEPRISADGRWVAFLNDGVAADPALSPSGSSILLHDRVVGTTGVVPVTGADGSPPGWFANLAISGDGGRLAFASYSAVLVDGDTNRDSDVFVLDRSSGSLTLASRNPAGRQPLQADRPLFSDDGRSLVFRGYGRLTPEATEAAHIYVRDLVSGQVRLVDISSDGVAADGYSDSGSAPISADGTRVAFSSEGTNLGADDTNGTTDIFVRDLRPAPPAEPGEVTGVVTGGGTVTTDPTGAGATVGAPLQTAITAPAAVSGRVGVDTRPTTTPAPAGVALLGTELVLEGPPATAEQPYEVRFTVEATQVGAVAPGDVQVLRDGSVVADCTAAVAAAPDPCVSARGAVSPTDPDAPITVRTSRFSTWTLGVPDYDLSGPTAPVDAHPVLNTARAGSAVPVKFTLGGDRGPDVLARGYRVTRTRPTCASTGDEIEQTVSTAAASLQYDRASGRYTYVWKTARTAAGCVDLVLRFRDGSELRAAFRLR